MNVPQLRFKGFNEKWQHRKISEVMTVKAGGDVDKAKLKVTGKYPVIANALTNNGIIGYYDDYQIKAPAVTITGRGTLGHAVARFVSFTPVVRLLVARSATMSANFIANAINRLHIYNESTGVPQLTAVQLKTYAINYPILSEQQKIGTFFSKLDDLITKQTHKVTLLKQLKQGYLQKLFPQAGQTTPQLRFKGFNDEWQSKKLKEIADIERGLTYSPEDIADNEGIIVVRSSNIKNSIFYLGNSNIVVKKSIVNIPLLKKGDIVVTAANGSTKLVGKHAMITAQNDKLVHGGFMLKISSSYNSFINQWMSTDDYIKQIHKMIQGGSGALGNISSKNLQNLKIKIPQEQEHQKISALFAKLDHLIELQNHKLQLLQELKKGYLQKMFV